MAQPYVGEIRMFAGNFAPAGWMFCEGQLLPISENETLFQLIGTTYGGDGKSNFALPNMQGNAPMHPGQGPGLSLHDLGETGGTQFVTLLESEMPSHPHNFMAANLPANSKTPSGNSIARGSANTYLPPAGLPIVPMSDQALAPTGGDQPHNNMQPFLTLSFCIALQGVFPPRS